MSLLIDGRHPTPVGADRIGLAFRHRTLDDPLVVGLERGQKYSQEFASGGASGDRGLVTRANDEPSLGHDGAVIDQADNLVIEDRDEAGQLRDLPALQRPIQGELTGSGR